MTLLPHRRTACVVTVGDELLRGDITDTNGTEASRILAARSITTRSRHTVADRTCDIAQALTQGLAGDDLVVVIGGLGPTSDDVTRFAVADALGVPVVENLPVWQSILDRLDSFGIPAHPDNRRQAQFPEGGIPLPNDNGTAWGAHIPVAGRYVLVLPGPPRECLPMLESALDNLGWHTCHPEPLRWRVLGLHEPDVATRIDALLALNPGQASVSYRWAYPYVDITLHAAPEQDLRLAAQINHALDGHIVSTDHTSALEQLRNAEFPYELYIHDRLTHGRFSHILGAPAHPEASLGAIEVEAMGIWEGGSPQDHSGSVRMLCDVAVQQDSRRYEMVQPNLGTEILDCAAEFIAWSILRALATLHIKPDPSPHN
ncbi:competence/damage-inducible protein A [Streptomyces sp. cg36]|uniref:competence/damage-inducible protein A n=1 Tax=Streptomyces sp. cg36 TaxID=3238798 RepID=UPI0034E2CD7C